MLRENLRKFYCFTDGGSHGDVCIGNIIQGVGSRVEVLCSFWGGFFNPFLFIGDLMVMIFNIFTCS